VKLRLQNLTEKTFSEYGQIISPESVKPSDREELYDWWADLVLFDKISNNYGVGMAKVQKHSTPQRCAERHMATPEFLLPIGGDMGIIIGPPDYPEEPSRLPDISRFAAFRIREGEGALLKPGVWHWVPYPLQSKIHMLVIFAVETSKKDLTVSEFPNGSVLELEL
jgi:ureidoglycolate hydrolase